MKIGIESFDLAYVFKYIHDIQLFHPVNCDF